MVKTKPFRSKPLREAYRLLPCQWTGCGIVDGSVCCAHSNFAEFGGKGGARKADDNKAASLCYYHHTGLDQGNVLTYEQRKAEWLAAHERTVAALIELSWEDHKLRKLVVAAGWVK